MARKSALAVAVAVAAAAAAAAAAVVAVAVVEYLVFNDREAEPRQLSMREQTKEGQPHDRQLSLFTSFWLLLGTQ